MTLIAPRKTTPSHRFPIISEPVVNVADWKLPSGKNGVNYCLKIPSLVKRTPT